MTLAFDRPDLGRIGESAFQEVLGALFSRPPILPDASSHRPLPRASDQITSNVLLAGPRLSGSVHLQLPRTFMMRLAQVLTGLDGAAGENDALLKDAAGELANMVAGRVAAGLATHGYPCTLGIPSVCPSAPLPSELQPGADHGRTDLMCEGHWLSLEVYCRFASP